MKISKRQLRRIIKEEKQKLAREARRPDGRTHPSRIAPAEQAQLHMSGRNQGAMEQLHTAIDALINAVGNEEALMELTGIVEEWN
jgi:hypothetical protein